MDNSLPKVSIGLPVFNGEEYLEEAIASILGQTYPDFELIISDNASTDATEQIALSYRRLDERVRYHRYAQNIGLVNNFNLVVTLATGDYFQWMAYDDLLEPEYLSTCVKILEQHPSVFLAYTDSRFVNGSGDPILGFDPWDLHLRSPNPHDRWESYLKSSYPSGGYNHVVYGVMRRSQLLSTSLFVDYPGSDQILLGILALEGEFHRVPEILFVRRIHSQGITEGNPDLNERAYIMNPNFQGRILFPHWRYLIEYLAAPLRASIPFREKIRCLPPIFKYYFRYRVRFMLGDLLKAVQSIFHF